MKEFDLLDRLNIINIKTFPKHIKEIFREKIKTRQQCDQCKKRFKATDLRVIDGLRLAGSKFYYVNLEETDSYSGSWYGDNDRTIKVMYNGGRRNACKTSVVRKCRHIEILE